MRGGPGGRDRSRAEERERLTGPAPWYHLHADVIVAHNGLIRATSGLGFRGDTHERWVFPFTPTATQANARSDHAMTLAPRSVLPWARAAHKLLQVGSVGCLTVKQR